MNRHRFLLFAGLVQGGVLLLAVGVGYGLGISPTKLVRWSNGDLIGGLVAVLPLLAV